jgi:hypothetical protein
VPALALDVLLTVPHGAAGNDVAAPPVAKALRQQLAATPLRSALAISRADRIEVADMNRQKGRGSRFRRAVDSVISEQRPRLLLDVHSFPDDYPRFEHADIVLLATPRVTDLGFLHDYVRRMQNAAEALGLEDDFAAAVYSAEHHDDIIIRGRELGMAADAVMLAEHNEQGDPSLYAAIHARALESLFKSRGWIT